MEAHNQKNSFDDTNPPKIAVIGCGGWGKNIVRTMHALGYLSAVIDPSESGRATAKELVPDIPVYADSTHIFADKTISAVMIATPAETHFSIATSAILAGKDVYIEKPMTIDLDEASQLVELAELEDRILMVGHLLEYHPAICKIEKLVQQGVLGEIKYIVSNRLNLGKLRTEENVLWSFAPHDISVILRLMDNPPVEVTATGGTYLTDGIPDISVTQLRFENGARAHVFASWLHPYKEQKLIVIGDKKMLTYCDITKELLLHDQHVQWNDGIPTPVKGESDSITFSDEMPLDIECQHFADCVAGRTTVRTDGQNGYRVLSVLQSAQQSIEAQGKPVKCKIVSFKEVEHATS